MAESVQVFSSVTPDYHRAFQCFLDHTDQKHKAKQWMEIFVGTLPQKKLFLDAGAGNGKVTAWFAGQFERTIALEPNPSLCAELRQACSDAEVHQQTILDAKIKASADFILASHVFYYISKEDWTANLARLASWLSPKGSLVVMLQNAGTDCMRMLRYFFKKSFDLKGLLDDFKAEHGGQYAVTIETVPSYITTKDFKSAYTIAEFMMNLLSMPQPPLRKDLEAYVKKNFAADNGGYRFSCHQDFLQIRPVWQSVPATLQATL